MQLDIGHAVLFGFEDREKHTETERCVDLL